MVVFVIMEEREIYDNYHDVDHIADVIDVYISRELAEQNLRKTGWIQQLDGLWDNKDLSAIRWISEQNVIGA